MTTTRLLGGKTAVVTGSSSGIGAVIARELARQGARVGLLARSGERLEEVRRTIHEGGGEALVAPADVTDMSSLEGAVGTVRRAYGPIDLLVSNAGAAPREVFLCEQSEEQWRRTVDINLTGGFRVARLVVKEMMDRRSGSIVFISSVVGKRGLCGNSAYSAAKFGLLGLMEALTWEMGRYNVRVNAVCPGLTDTAALHDPARYGASFVDSLRRHHGPPDLTWERYLRAAIRSTALGRLISPAEVARLTVFLLSPLAEGITGQAINIDGGGL